MLGHNVSEEQGMLEMAQWIAKFVTESTSSTRETERTVLGTKLKVKGIAMKAEAMISSCLITCSVYVCEETQA